MKQYLRKFKLFPHFPFLIVLSINLFALVILYSISSGNFFPWCFKQLFRLAIGILMLFVGFLTPLNVWKKHAYELFLICLGMLMFVEVSGKVSMGAQRWINLYFFNFQPSELMRIFLVFALAKYFSCRDRKEILKTRTLIPPLIMICLPTMFVLLQPDLGTAMLLLLVSGSVFFVCGVQVWKFVVLLISAIVCAPFIWNSLHEYQQNRVLMFLSPELDPNGAGYHIIQSKIALGSGGFFGKGLMNGSQCQLNFLPEKQTDFIFSSLGEELGFVGCIILISLYILLLTYNFVVAIKSRNAFNRIVAFGINAMLFFYICINISMVCGLLPVVGIPLPFFSYGGSALIVLMFCQGIIFAISISDRIKSKFM